MIIEAKKGKGNYPVELIETLPNDKIIIAQELETQKLYLVKCSPGFFEYNIVCIDILQDDVIKEISEETLFENYKLYMLDSIKDLANLE